MSTWANLSESLPRLHSVPVQCQAEGRWRMGLNQELLKVYGSRQLLWLPHFSSPCALCSSSHRKIHEQTVRSADLLLSEFINLFSFNFPISNLLLQCFSWRRVSLMPNPDLSHAWARSMLDFLSTYMGCGFFPCKISSFPRRHVRLSAQLLPAGCCLLGFLWLDPMDHVGEMSPQLMFADLLTCTLVHRAACDPPRFVTQT